jgi:hypothetical protein
MPRLAFLGAFALAALGCRTSPSSAPVPVASDSGAYVLRLGNDTIAAESFTRAGNRIEGIIVRRVPRTTVLRYVMTCAARLSVDYGRPAKRGRTIFGPTGVLGDTLWRTGANAETKFRSDAPLSFAGQVLPAGTYSLMTLAIPGRHQLIFYTPDREFRVPLQEAQLSAPIERFTIVIEPTGGNSGAIRLRWDTTQLSVPFTVSQP